MRDPVRKKEGIRALIVFPIMSQGQLIAVINLASHRYDSIPEDTRKSLEIIAFQVGSTLLRLRKDTLLRENEEIFNQFMTNSPIYIFFKDENIRPLKLSSNYEKMLGKPVKELLGKTMDELFPSELAKTMVADDLRILKEGKQISVEEVFNGRHYSTVKFPIQIEGEPRFLSGYTIDITERKQAEEKLRESEGKYRTIVETTMEWIWEIDVNGRHIFSNPKISDILGYSIEEIMGNSADEFIHPDDRKEVETKMSLYIAEKQGWRSWVLRWKHKDGSYRYLESNACPIFNNTGDLIGYQGADRDITDRILAEEKRIEIERHLFHVQKLESLGLLAGGIAHDFNNLLAVILGNLELAMDDIPPDSIVRPFLEGAFNASKKSASLTRQMLAYSGKGRFIIENINISELVQENFNIFRSSIPGTITMNLHMNADIPFINADASQIQQVVMNLITNAAESIGEKAGDITISTDVLACDERFLSLSRIEQKPEPGNFIFLEVSDTGCGMDDNTLKKLFDPFFTTKFTGRGLGMAALQGIIRSHKGAIMVESSLNHGTTVRIYFPVAPGENSDSMNTVSAHQTRSSSIEPSLSAGVILIVDDDLAILKLCSSIVRRFGFSVMTAVDGREAVEIYGNNADQITCVILDLTMPKMDGVATFKAMKDIRHDVKVILSSGYSEQAATEHFKGTGLTGFIQKPYGKQELMDKLNLVLKK
jgi:PAS domain S-box-containing protein